MFFFSLGEGRSTPPTGFFFFLPPPALLRMSTDILGFPPSRGDVIPPPDLFEYTGTGWREFSSHGPFSLFPRGKKRRLSGKRELLFSFFPLFRKRSAATLFFPPPPLSIAPSPALFRGNLSLSFFPHFREENMHRSFPFSFFSLFRDWNFAVVRFSYCTVFFFSPPPSKIGLKLYYFFSFFSFS